MSLRPKPGLIASAATPSCKRKPGRSQTDALVYSRLRFAPRVSRLEPAALNGAKKRTKSANSWGFWRSLVVTLAVALGVRHFLIEARYIPSGSMLPGLQLQDRLLVEKLTYRTRPPKRGEIVVFRAPQSFDPALKQDYAVSPCAVSSPPCRSLVASLGCNSRPAKPSSSGWLPSPETRWRWTPAAISRSTAKRSKSPMSPATAPRAMARVAGPCALWCPQVGSGARRQPRQQLGWTLLAWHPFRA